MRGEYNEPNEPPHVQTFEYDQLNRLLKSEAYEMTSTVANSNLWNSINSVNNYKTNYSYDPNGNLTTLQRYNNEAVLMDDFTYNYQTGRNRLRHVNDAVADGVSTDDIDNQDADNYAYDKIGNLIKDEQEEIAQIEWNVSGKVKSITRAENSTKPDLEFRYDAMGNRVAKIAKPRPGGNPSNEDKWEYTYYIRDANGNTMATYSKKTIEDTDNDNYQMQYALEEHTLYGSSRLGVMSASHEAPLSILTIPNTVTFQTNGSFDLTTVIATLTQYTGNPNLKLHYIGAKQYELTNHLGNVLATVSDKKIPIEDNGEIVGFEADVKSAQLYYPFGMTARKYQAGNYKYDFNGKPTDVELVDWQDYGMRMYMKRLGRFPTVDPLHYKYAYYSPYHFAGNKPIVAVDLDGREDLWIHFVEQEDGSVIAITDYQKVSDLQNFLLNQQYGNGENTIGNSGTLLTYSSNITGEDRVISYTPDVATVSEYKYNVVYRSLLKLEHAHQGYQGDEGFKKFGEDMQKGSTYAKISGIVITALGFPEFGIPIYKIGDVMSQTSDVIQLVSEINDNDKEAAILTGSKIMLNYGGGRMIKETSKNDEVRDLGKQAAVDLYIDKTFENNNTEKND